MCEIIPGQVKRGKSDEFVYLRIPEDIYLNADNYLSMVDSAIHGVLFVHDPDNHLEDFKEYYGVDWDDGWTYKGLQFLWYKFRDIYFQMLIESTNELDEDSKNILINFCGMEEKYREPMVELMLLCGKGKIAIRWLTEFIEGCKKIAV